MTKQEFKELVAKGKVVLDGATGSNLMKAGMPRGVCSEAWIYENPQALIELQKAYAEAGSDIIYAPTFSANRISLANHGLEDKVEELNRGLVKITKDAVGDKCLVAGDVTTTGKQEIAYEELLEAYTEQIRWKSVLWWRYLRSSRKSGTDGCRCSWNQLFNRTGPVSIGCGKHQKTSTDSGDCKTKCGYAGN